MAKRNIRKTDSQDTNAQERQRSPGGANGAAESTTRAPRARRKPAAAMATAPAEMGAATVGEAAATPQQTAPPAAASAEDRPPVATPGMDEVPHEHIAVRAYHLYLERGGRGGGEFEDWITAERELRERAAGSRFR